MSNLTITVAGVALAVAAGTLWLLAQTGPATQSTAVPATLPASDHTQIATFAAGCFWGVQSTFDRVPGVMHTQVGYTGGTTRNPTYRDVCSGLTGHHEALRIEYDPTKVTYQQLLDVFFENHDPTTEDQQGPDVGTQYRSVIFFHTPEQQKQAQAEKDRRDASGEYAHSLATQIVKAGPFYPAEEYHQKYFEKKGVNWSCHYGNGKKRQTEKP
jgi:peptide-methionine (S)-S-oxide reductase